MSVLEGVWVGLSLFIALLDLRHFLLLGQPRCLFSLFARELTSFNHPLLFDCLLKFGLLLRILLLLLEFGLRCRCRLRLKVLQLLLFLHELDLSFLFFEDSLDFSLLHGAYVGDVGTMAH